MLTTCRPKFMYLKETRDRTAHILFLAFTSIALYWLLCGRIVERDGYAGEQPNTGRPPTVILVLTSTLRKLAFYLYLYLCLCYTGCNDYTLTVVCLYLHMYLYLSLHSRYTGGISAHIKNWRSKVFECVYMNIVPFGGSEYAGYEDCHSKIQ